MFTVAEAIAHFRTIRMHKVSWLLIVLSLAACQPVIRAQESANVTASSAPMADVLRDQQIPAQANVTASSVPIADALRDRQIPVQQIAITAAPSIPHYTIELENDAIVAPPEVSAGLVTFTIKNSESQPASGDLIIGRLKDGKSLDDLHTAMVADDPTLLLNTADFLGGAIGDVTFDLQPGQYFVLLNHEDATPDLTTFTATGSTPLLAKPVADVQVEMVDFRYMMPDRIKAGPQLWQISNQGKQWHNVWLWKLNDGVSQEQFLDWVMGDDHTNPPATSIFDWAPTTSGMTAWAALNLSAGEYLVICPLPDLSADPPMPHFAKGMVHKLTVLD